VGTDIIQPRLRVTESDVTGNFVTVHIGLVQAEIHGIHRNGIDFRHAAVWDGAGNHFIFDLPVQRYGDYRASLELGAN